MSNLSPDQVPEGWSRIATAYERAFEKLTTQFSREALRQLQLKRGERVLDVAAGTGCFSLAAARAGGEVHATDFASGMIERIQRHIEDEGLGNIKAEVMDGQQLDIADAAFDVSASIVGLIFFPDIKRGMAELKRVLKPGGRCAVVCWGERDKFQMMSYLTQAIRAAVPEFELPQQTPVWARLAGSDQLRKEMTAAGFRDVCVNNMTGSLEMESPEEFWRDFTSSAPPLAELFKLLGEENTRKTGNMFATLLRHDFGDKVPCLTSEACIGIGYA